MTTESTVRSLIKNVPAATIHDVTAVRSGVNTSYRAQTDTETYFIKFGTDGDTAILSEAAILRTVSGVIPVPDIYASGQTDTDVPYFIAGWIDGAEDNYNMTAQDTWLATELGVKLARMHEEFTFDAGHIYSSDGETLQIKDVSWQSLFTDWLLTYAEDAKKNYPSVGSDLIRLIHWCDVPTLDDGAVFSPLDYHGGNVLTKNQQVAALIDFERCYAGHPRWSYSITKRLLELDAEVLGSAFEDGYTSVRTPPSRHSMFEIAGMIRELRMAHMLFDDVTGRREVYQREIAQIEAEIKERQG